MDKITKIIFRQDTSANLNLVNPVLASGEPCYELDTGNFKIGDGVSTWNQLQYQVNQIKTTHISVNINITELNTPNDITLIENITDLISFTGMINFGSDKYLLPLYSDEIKCEILIEDNTLKARIITEVEIEGSIDFYISYVEV